MNTSSNLVALPFPFAPKRIALRDGDMSVVDEGSGVPLVFVHGTPTWSFLWRSAVGTLRDRARCIAVDHLGFGLSDRPADADGSLRAHARRLGEVIDTLELDRVVLVVHDVGGPIALSWAADNPERVSGIVLLNSFVRSPALDANWLAGAMLRFFASRPGNWLYRTLGVSQRALLPAAFHRAQPATIATYQSMFPDSASRSVMAQIPALLIGRELEELRPRLASLADLPVEIVWGDDDQLLPAACLETVTQCFPNAAVAHCAACGHFPQEEAPDAVNSAVVRMLERVEDTWDHQTRQPA